MTTADEWPVPDAIRRIQLAPNETLAVIYHKPVDFDQGQHIVETLVDILGVESGRVVVLSGADDLIAITTNDNEEDGA